MYYINANKFLKKQWARIKVAHATRMLLKERNRLVSNLEYLGNHGYQTAGSLADERINEINKELNDYNQKG